MKKRTRSKPQPTAPPIDYAALFRQRVSEHKESAPTVKREFDGIPLVVRRLNLRGWMRTGRMPEFLALYYTAQSEEDKREIKQQMTGEELRSLLEFHKDVVRESVVLPVVVFDERQLEANEISFKELAESGTEVIEELVAWQIIGAPGIPVTMKGGETAQVSDIENFREGQGTVHGSGASGGQVGAGS